MKKAFLLRRRDGMALVITLSLVVLVTVAAVAFFSRATSNRSIESSRANEVLADQLAQTAAAHVTGQFLQEIAAGSNATTVNGTTIFRPLTPANAVPQRRLVLTSMTSNATFTNLVRQSGPADSAQPDADGTAAPAANGRSITSTAWSKPLLLNGSNTTSTPGTFSANNTLPQWIYITRNGTTGNLTTLSANAVVGRFAYNVYDIGGLLDANVAGCPTSVSSNSTLLKEIKDTLAGADLTALLGNSTAAVTAINDLIQFRNPGYASSPADYINYVKDAKKRGFLTINASSGNASRNSTTLNNFFTTRQDLIRYAQSTNSTVLTNALPYLTHYSRALEQPSFIPHPDRPRITPTKAPPDDPFSYRGNNSYAGDDDTINLANGGFLSVRVQSPFTRLNGTAAIPGEPLVKTRFALSNLTRVTTNATASRSPTDPIYTRFGIFRSNPSEPWIYNHGNSNRIMRLDEVATANREPDFAELLKAAIHAGSLGKGASTNQGRNFSYFLDISGDRQILQIMANLIDQVKPDNYPTAILPFNNMPSTLAVYGTQDLPYFYNWHFFSVTTRLPNPLLSNADVVSLPNGNLTQTGYRMREGELIDGGSASYLIIPQIWKPHDANTAQVSGPSSFRIVAETTDPTGTLGYWKIKAAPEMNAEAFDGANWIDALKPPSSAKSSPVELNATNASLRFEDASNGRAFREPTLLWRNNIPTGVSLSGVSRTEVSSLSGKTYFGILVGDTAVSWNATLGNRTYICQTSALQRGISEPGPSSCINDNIVFRMQYQSPSGQWITYQNVFSEAKMQDVPGFPLFVNPLDWPNKKYANPLTEYLGGTALSVPRGGLYDPRTSRFSTPSYGFFTQDDPILNGNPTLDAITMKNNSASLTASENQMVTESNFVLMATQRPSTSRGQYFTWTNPAGSDTRLQGFYSPSNSNQGGNYGGLYSQNNPSITLEAGVQNYYEDPDGICRRAMGAYTSSGGSAVGRGTNATSTLGLPLATATTDFNNGLGTRTSQSQSRPILLHRPFRSVSEMSYAFRGSPWKNIDFFTPESGDSALLDVFCVEEVPPSTTVAGKVNLNTAHSKIIESLLIGAARDELGEIPPINAVEARNVAEKLLAMTSSSDSWLGPLTNRSELVGKFSTTAPSGSTGHVYQYTSRNPSTASKLFTFSGLSSAIDASVFASSPQSSASIQRFREAVLRPLIDSGQTRVWNLLIDVVAQCGKLASDSNVSSKFMVQGEKRCWVHLTIDRFTGKLVDQQIEYIID